MGITNFDIVDANDHSVNGESLIPITTYITKTVAAVGDSPGVSDFDTFEEALVWVSKNRVKGTGRVTLSLADGEHHISEVHGAFSEIIIIKNMDLIIESASSDKTLCLITTVPDSTLSTTYFLQFWFSKIAMFNITINLNANGNSAIRCYSFISLFYSSIGWFEDCTFMYLENAIQVIDHSSANVKNVVISNSGTSALRATRNCRMVVEGTVTIDSMPRGIYIESCCDLTIRANAVVTISNCTTNGIRIFQSRVTTSETGTLTFVTNTADTNMTLNEIQYDGSFITDGTSALSFKV